MRVFRKIWRYQFEFKDEDEDLFQPALKNEDVENSIFFHIEEWRWIFATFVKDEECILKKVEDRRFEEPC